MHGATDTQNPYIALTDKSQIDGRFMFTFAASILNTNKALAQAALQDMMGVLITPLMLQLGISTPDTIYSLVKDYIKSKGQEYQKYSVPPQGTMDSGAPKISAEDVIQAIMNGYYPHGEPMEPLEIHIQRLKEFVSNPENFKILTESQARLLGQYAAVKITEMQQKLQRQQMMENAAAFQQQNNQPGQPGPKGAVNPPNTGPGGNPKVNKNELLNESLPSAGGGGNANK